MLLSDAPRGGGGTQIWFQQCIIRKHNGHILYDEGMTTVIHPGTWSQHPFVSARVCFFWDALYTRNRDSERSMINATTRERRFERRLQRRFDYGY